MTACERRQPRLLSVRLQWDTPVLLESRVDRAGVSLSERTSSCVRDVVFLERKIYAQFCRNALRTVRAGLAAHGLPFCASVM